MPVGFSTNIPDDSALSIFGWEQKNMATTGAEMLDLSP
jgi:hypothetical protein